MYIVYMYIVYMYTVYMYTVYMYIAKHCPNHQTEASPLQISKCLISIHYDHEIISVCRQAMCRLPHGSSKVLISSRWPIKQAD